MAVFRVEKNSNYTTMCNYHLRDRSITLKAKGLLSMLLSLPEKWHYSVRGLAAISLEGTDGIVAALRELEGHGYLERRQSRMANGRMGETEYTIYEMPKGLPDKALPCTGKPYAAGPGTASPSQIRKDVSRKETEKKESLKKELFKNGSNEVSSGTEEEGDRDSLLIKKYGLYQNVFLTEEELEHLRAEFPADYLERLERLSEYMASTGKSYKSHLATIRSWARKETKNAAGYGYDRYRFREGDSL